MPTIRERAKANGTRIFHVQVRMSGFPARTASFPTRRQAERWSKVIEAEMIDGKHFRTAEARRRTVGDAIDRYLEEELPKKRNGGMHRINLPKWKERLGTLKLADVTPALLVEHRGKLGRETFSRAKPQSKRSTVKEGEEAKTFKRSPQTVDRYMATLRHVLTVARKEWHWISHDPFASVSRVGTSKGRIRFLSEDERKRLFAETARDPTLHTFVIVALATACRAGELLKLTWQDVDLTEKRLLFQETKNGQQRAAWLHAEALRQLQAHHDRVDAKPDRRVFSNLKRGAYGYAKPFQAAVAKAGITGFRFHDLRHSAATYLAREGATEQQLRAIGGWKSGIVSRYVHLAAEDGRAVLEKMNNKILGEG